MPNTWKAVLVALALFLVVDGSLYRWFVGVGYEG